jgi:hypothetical protein
MSTNIDTKTMNISFVGSEIYNQDRDNDGIKNNLDNCPLKSNKDQKDADKDLIGDVCDLDPKNRNPLL